MDNLSKKLPWALPVSHPVKLLDSFIIEKQMKKMGWKEGQGLGKDETGSTDYIKVTVKNVL